MISTTYDLRCETFYFAWRKIRFVSAGFGLVDAGTKWAVVSSLGITQNVGDLEVAVGKIAQESSQVHEIIGARKLVRGLDGRCQLR